MASVLGQYQPGNVLGAQRPQGNVLGGRPSFASLYPGVGLDTAPLRSMTPELAAALAQQGMPSLAPSQMVQGVVGGVADLAMQANQAMPWGGNDPSAIGIDPQAGTIDPSVMVPFATNVAGMASTGSLAAPAVEGGLGMGIRAYHGSPHDFDRPPTDLPMDSASQLERAKAGGFRMDMPLYKGMDQEVTGFDPAYRGTASGSLAATEGFSVALDPETASEFATRAKGEKPGNGQIYPLRHRAERPAVLQLDGDETDKEIAGVLRDAWEAGHDAVLMRNYTTPDGLKGKNILWVKDENQLRSPNANFDPAKRSSRDILSSYEGEVSSAAA